MKIGIIAAMEKEINIYFNIYNFKLIDEKFKIYKTSISNKEIYLCLCGIGKVNSAILTEYLIEHYKIEFIINSGCCGSLIDNLDVLDTILVNEVSYHDFTPTRIMELAVPDNGKIKVNNKYLNIVKEILDSNNIKYHIGGIVSGDSFITDSSKRDEIYNKTKAISVDMESASIAHTCKINNINFIIIRSISDFADGSIEQEEIAANKSALIVKEFINKL